MTTTVERSIRVDVPVSVAYNQWTQFEEFPRFMGGVSEVTQLDDRHVRFVAQIAGVRREWEAEILEQIPDSKIAWAAVEGATNAGAVFFTAAGPEQTYLTLWLQFEPTGGGEKFGERLHLVERRAEADLQRFKRFIEAEGSETGRWRGRVEGAGTGTPYVADAAASRNDSGKAGLSREVLVGALGAAAAAVAGARKAASAKRQQGEKSDSGEPTLPPPVADTRVGGESVTSGRQDSSTRISSSEPTGSTSPAANRETSSAAPRGPDQLP